MNSSSNPPTGKVLRSLLLWWERVLIMPVLTQLWGVVTQVLTHIWVVARVETEEQVVPSKHLDSKTLHWFTWYLYSGTLFTVWHFTWYLLCWQSHKCCIVLRVLLWNYTVPPFLYSAHWSKEVLILTLILDLPYLYSEHVHNFVQNLFVLSSLRATDWLICLFVARGDEHTGYIDNLTQYRLWRSRATNRLFCC